MRWVQLQLILYTLTEKKIQRKEYPLSPGNIELKVVTVEIDTPKKPLSTDAKRKFDNGFRGVSNIFTI